MIHAFRANIYCGQSESSKSHMKNDKSESGLVVKRRYSEFAAENSRVQTKPKPLPAAAVTHGRNAGAGVERDPSDGKDLRRSARHRGPAVC